MMSHIKQIKFNRAQLISQLYPVTTKMELWGRGSGKTFLMAKDTIDAVHAMPGASFVIVGRSYANLEKIVLPQLIASWKALGYFPEIHYELNRRPDKRKGWAEPFVAPISYDHFIPWYNGAGFYIASQDKDTPFRGPSIDGVYVDEALLIDKDRFDNEIVPTNRGRRFNHPLHHFYRYYSTKPYDSSGSWMFKLAEYYPDEILLNYRRYQNTIAQMTMEFLDSSDRSYQKRLFDEIKRLKAAIKWYPDSRNNKFYSEYDFWDNIPNISIADVQNMRVQMSNSLFRIEVLNENIDGIEGGFYSTFNKEKHVRLDTFNYSHIDNLRGDLKAQKDCRWDNDIAPGMSLKIAVDWGGIINTALVWQRRGELIAISNHLWAPHPEKIRDLARKFIAYYLHHPTKHVELWNDHTGDNKNPSNVKPWSEEFAGYLRDAGWTVTMMSKNSKPPTHTWKYYKAQSVFAEEDKRQAIIRINGNNCANLVTAINLTPLKRSKDKIEKDKSSESDKKFPQEKATHVTDCLDLIIRAETADHNMHSFIDVMG